MLKKTLLAAAVLACATTAVQANEVSGYVTGSIGQAKADKSKYAKDLQNNYKAGGNVSSVSSSTSSDRTDTAYKLAVGLQANPYVGLELQYVDLGRSKYKGSESGPQFPTGFFSENEKVDFKTSGLGVNLVGTLPIEDFTLFAKAGYHYLKTKTSFEYTDIDTVSGDDYESMSKTVRKWAPSFGVGASYNITPEFAVVAEYERYKGVADKKSDYFGSRVSIKHDIDLASVGLRYNF
ncbi:MAG: outer membrane beta-barrel protein [Gammaproteobacteria bacterium]|nr:outer membrane beta-barrel protein [Gammaproteobacteria bacterium]